jgi:hypothetical protein
MYYLHSPQIKQMTINTVILRNQVLQYALTHNQELSGGVLYLKTPLRHGTVDVYGCTIHGEVLGVDNDGTEISVSYNESNNWSVIDRLFVELFHDYCREQQVFN